MNRFDERRSRFWRHGRDRDRDEMYRDQDHRFRAGEDSGRTPGDSDRQPYSGNPYGYYPGQDRSRREWGGRWSRDSQSRDDGERGSPRYGQREPYNARGGARGMGGRSGPWNDQGSRYSESQYGTGRSHFEPYGDRYEPEFGEGPFADTSESPGYFGSGNYGDGGTSHTGGYDQRSRSRNPGSLGEDSLSHNPHEQRRYRTGPKGYTRSDERIREDICERLMLADGIDSSEVSVSVKDGKVSLEGTVPTRSMKHGIEDLADYTAGVQDVDNRIRVERSTWEAGRSGTSTTGVQTASGITPTGSIGGKTTKQ